MANPPVQINATGSLDKGQMDRALWMNGATTGLNWLSEMGDKIANYSLMNKFFGLQTDQMTKYFDMQGKLVGLNETLISSNERIAIKGMSTTKEIAELQKERDVAVAKTKAEAAVKIAKVTALNSQFYGQPSQIPS